MEDREQKIKEQKSLNLKKFQDMKKRLIIEKNIREKTNEKSQKRQERYEGNAKTMKLEREKRIQERAKSQSLLFSQNQENKDKMRDELIKKYNLLEKEMKEKEEKEKKRKN